MERIRAEWKFLKRETMLYTHLKEVLPENNQFVYVICIHDIMAEEIFLS